MFTSLLTVFSITTCSLPFLVKNKTKDHNILGEPVLVRNKSSVIPLFLVELSIKFINSSKDYFVKSTFCIMSL